MAKVYQMLWDCQFCGTEKLLAKTHRACPKCKAPQDPAWRYLPSEDEQVEVKNYLFKGKDKQCAACNSLNVATANFCQSCGASLQDTDALSTELSSGQGDGTFAQQGRYDNWSLEEQIRITEEALAAGHWPGETPDEKLQRLKSTLKQKPAMQKPLSQGQVQQSQTIITPRSPIEKWLLSPIKRLIAQLALLGCITCLVSSPFLVWAFLVFGTGLLSLWQEPTPTPKVPTILKVTGHSWQRTITIETYQRLTKSNWKSKLPSDAMYTDSLSCEGRERKTDDGTTTAPYCTYNVDRWQKTDEVEAAGNGLEEEPYWPNPDFKACEDKLGCRREGARRETYTLQLLDAIEDKQHTCNVSYSVWKASSIGTQFKVKVKFGSALRDRDCAQMKQLQ